ncbi:alpha/beta hydrolase fold domain-containing protein [Pandoraea fibrosis]|uniref:Alpha/beta hydrolase fold domain-containing protein n=1 Tax=Pandoraea fibrosis TaxID=1891094 RepID=A0ABX6HSB8_9BURK|nr:alpha/beta hydrolase [Pandoraea fibrosis]QHE92637.1 alpha/beta hydrolase fold domain-containing protein [Pandoraea fibrosis]QHF13807.1 alpha/beta hydrolase fold domain-containing protein [Pandoraea fibrosis]
MNGQTLLASAAGWQEARARMRALGPRWAQDIAAGRRAVLETYTPLLARLPVEGYTVVRDVAYGPHARHRLDVYRPTLVPAAGSPAPVVVFVHGGGFVRGDMNANAQIYGNVPRYFARHGCVAVNAEYRLAPEAPFPGGAQDVAAAMRWVHAHLDEYAGEGGVDLSRIVLIGHSAGGSHVASYLCDPRVRPAQPEVAGAVLISARLRADVLPDNPNAPGVVAYYGDDPVRHASDAPMAHADAMPVPVMTVIAEFENPHLDTYALEFCHRLAQRDGRAPRLRQVRDHNHTSVVAHIDSGDDSLGREILQFLHEINPSP